MLYMNLQLFGGRGGSSGMGGSGFGSYSEHYQTRLRQIDADIRRHQIAATMDPNSSSAAVRRKIASAQRSIERLRQQYKQVEAAAKRHRRDRQDGAPSF